MVAEQEITYKLDLRQQKCPACGSNSRWDPRILGQDILDRTASKLHIHCDCGMGILEIELVK